MCIIVCIILHLRCGGGGSPQRGGVPPLGSNARWLLERTERSNARRARTHGTLERTADARTGVVTQSTIRDVAADVESAAARSFLICDVKFVQSIRGVSGSARDENEIRTSRFF